MAAKKAGDISSKRSRQELHPETSNCRSKDDADVFRNSESSSDSEDESSLKSSMQLSYEELGIAKLSGFHKWLSLHPIVTESGCERQSDNDNISHKMIIFAHHLKVLDGVQNFICERDIKFVRIDGKTLARDRQSSVQEFRSSPEVKVAIIGITAGGVGIDFSSAQNVVFLELPKSVSGMLQAEDRAHRRGQTNAVNIYIFCAKVGRVSNLGDKLGCKQFEILEESNVEDKDIASGSNPEITTDDTVSETRLGTKGSNMFLEPGGDENRSVELIEADSSCLLPADTL